MAWMRIAAAVRLAGRPEVVALLVGIVGVRRSVGQDEPGADGVVAPLQIVQRGREPALQVLGVVAATGGGDVPQRPAELVHIVREGNHRERLSVVAVPVDHHAEAKVRRARHLLQGAHGSSAARRGAAGSRRPCFPWRR